LRHGFRDAMRLLVFNSTVPLRYMSGVGILGSTLAFMGALYSILVCFFKHNTVEGWTSIVLLFSGLFCLMFIILAFFGEYLGRILDESTEREYHVVFERNSSVMVCVDRLNVLCESEAISVNAVQTGRAA
jgi:polyisoprenyl-phosphate glycosyltransferase